MATTDEREKRLYKAGQQERTYGGTRRVNERGERLQGQFDSSGNQWNRDYQQTVNPKTRNYDKHDLYSRTIERQLNEVRKNGWRGADGKLYKDIHAPVDKENPAAGTYLDQWLKKTFETDSFGKPKQTNFNRDNYAHLWGEAKPLAGIDPKYPSAPVRTVAPVAPATPVQKKSTASAPGIARYLNERVPMPDELKWLNDVKEKHGGTPISASESDLSTDIGGGAGQDMIMDAGRNRQSEERGDRGKHARAAHARAVAEANSYQAPEEFTPSGRKPVGPMGELPTTPTLARMLTRGSRLDNALPAGTQPAHMTQIAENAGRYRRPRADYHYMSMA